jgi:seryl-tRNA synthetase
MFSKIKNRLVDEHHRSKEELTYFLEKELEELSMQEKEVQKDIENNMKEKQKLEVYLEKIEKFKKADEEYIISESNPTKHTKPSPVEFPVLVMPFTGQ